jgi:hypothetical protein
MSVVPTRGADTVTVHLGRRPNLATVFTAFTAVSFVFGILFAIFRRGLKHILSDPEKLAFIGVLILSTTLLAIALYLQFRQRYLRVNRSYVTLQGPRSEVSVPVSQIVRLNYFKQSWLRSIYTIETREETTLKFALLGQPTLPHFQEALDYLEKLSGRSWTGRRSTARLPEFLTALRGVANARTNGQLATWVVARLFFVRGEEAGANDPLMRWGFYAVSWGLGFGLLALESLVFDFFDSPYPTVALIALMYLSICLGANVLLAFTRKQIRGREALEAEVAAAREVQLRLLPSRTPHIAGFELSGVCIPAREVGGDYYDFVALPSGQHAVVVADVSGKGLSAGLLMTLTKGVLATRLGSGDSDVEALTSVNRTIRTAAGRNRFVSMALARIGGGGDVSVVRAGHNPPFVVRQGKVSRISPPGLALGFAEDSLFVRAASSERFALGAGDTLVLYTDGVTEAMNVAGEEYGEERLARVVEKNAALPAEALQAAVIDDVQEFRGAAAPSDDLTLVIVKAV